MRVSVEERDEGYSNYCDAIKNKISIKALLDGEEQPNCITADEELGYMKKYVYPYQIIDDYYEIEELYGKVEIIYE